MECTLNGTRQCAALFFIVFASSSTATFGTTPGHEGIASRALWAREVHRRGVDPATIPYPLEYTQAMEDFARSVAGAGGPRDQLIRIQDGLIDDRLFPFDYDSRQTYTAVEAFEKREGNCVSFTNLFIALARSLGHHVSGALPTYRGEAEMDSELIVVNTHMVAVYERNAGMDVFDFGRLRERQRVGLLLIDDIRITALFLNNLGAEALLRGDNEAARDYLEKAIKLAPDFAHAHANLGVVLRKMGDTAAAIEAYLQALEIEPGSASVLNNLAALYQAEGRDTEAWAALQAAKLKDATPYLLIIRGELEVSKGRYRRALRLFRRAADLAPEMPEPLLAIARAHMAKGRPMKARKVLIRVIEMDPDNENARALLRNNDLL